MDIIPVFYSDSSGKAINTWIEEKDYKEGGPQSIVTLCKKGNLKQCVFVSNAFYDYPIALKLTQQAGIQLIFGLEVLMCPDRHDHSENSLNQNHKIIIFGKNEKSYKDLIKLYSAYKTDINAKYYKYRCDNNILTNYWTENLSLVLPFFDSFIAKNLLAGGASIIPNFPDTPITIFREVETEHPHERIINSALDLFNQDNKFLEVKTKTIYYENREDMDAYMVYRGIHNQASWHEPEMSYFCSNAFCFEVYKELTV